MPQFNPFVSYTGVNYSSDLDITISFSVSVQFLNCPPSAVLLLCDVSVEIIIPEEDKKDDHIDNHCLNINLTSWDKRYLKWVKIPLRPLWDSCSRNKESARSGETPAQIAPSASSSDI